MGANWTPSPLQRRECRQCGSHTYSELCGCCYSADLVPVDAHPLDRAEAVGIRPEARHWLPPYEPPNHNRPGAWPPARRGGS